MARNNYSGKFGAYLMGALTLIYIALLANTGIQLLALDELAAKAMGSLILVFPIFALWLTIREFIFGNQVERLASKIENAGKWPKFEFDYRPSGRPTRESADREFSKFAKLAEQNENDAIAWFSLGLAYDAAGDRTRARRAMRKALALDAKA